MTYRIKRMQIGETFVVNVVNGESITRLPDRRYGDIVFSVWHPEIGTDIMALQSVLNLFGDR